MTGIEWTDKTWNPATGCSKVSAGCAHCYAAVMAKRLQANGTKKYARGFDYTEHEDAIELPLKWRKPCRVFVNSMSDFFHEEATSHFQVRCMQVMQQCPQHDFQILTKRPTAATGFAELWQRFHAPWPPNVWLGTSVEDGRTAGRILDLEVPTALRFVSFEPLLGPITADELASVGFSSFQWAIVGGESGPGHRPMRAEWARTIRDYCERNGIQFFFKQWGGATPKSGGRRLDGREWTEWPERRGMALTEALA